jgi:hypothetical protein
MFDSEEEEVDEPEEDVKDSTDERLTNPREVPRPARQSKMDME